MASELISGGGVIVYPTDTVYGLGGDPFKFSVVSRVIHLKRRVSKPFPILLSDPGYAFRILEDNNLVRELMDLFWPGYLTIVSKAKIGLPATLGASSVGVRVPSHDRLRSIIRRAGGFLIGTSANISGLPPANSVDTAIKYFGGSVDLYVDGGLCGGSPSTVVYVGDTYLRVLRKGLLGVDAIKKFCLERGIDYYE